MSCGAWRQWSSWKLSACKVSANLEVCQVQNTKFVISIVGV